MRFGVVYALPFHRWILAPFVEIARAAGHEVIEVEHNPIHHHNWLTTHSFAGCPPVDVAICADGPIEPIRQYWPGAFVVAVRHSLASRGNTWARDHAKADRVVTWSTWDEIEWARRLIDIAPLRAGCLWAAPMAAGTWAGASPGQPGGRKRVTWAPSWNETWSARSQVAAALVELQRDGWAVRVRPHAVVDWREPGVLTSIFESHGVDKAALEWSNGSVPAHIDLLETDVLVSDVSGIALLAYVQSKISVVHVTPVQVGTRPDQYDRAGPEWVFREYTGEIVPDDRIESLVRAVHRADQPRYRLAREGVRATMLGSLDHIAQTPSRLLHMLEG